MKVSEGWLIAALLPLVGMIPTLWRISVAEPRERLVAQNLAALLTALTLLLAAQGFGRPAYLDLALVLAVLAPAGTLVYARFLGGMPSAPRVRWTAIVTVPPTAVALCVAAGPGRQAVKVLVIAVILLAGSVVTGAGSREESELAAAGEGDD